MGEKHVVEVAARGDDLDTVIVAEGLKADGAVLRQQALLAAAGGRDVWHHRRQRSRGGVEEERHAARDEVVHDAAACPRYRV